MKRTWVICVLSVTGLWAANETTEMAKQRAAASYGKLPLNFERNEGQTDARVRFLARGRGYGLFLTQREAVLSLAGAEKGKGSVLRVALGHASASAADPVGMDALEGKSNYFTGKDSSKWRSGVSNFAAVKYAGVYPGINLVYHGTQGQLEYDFDVAPGADPRSIELRFSGASKLRVSEAGNLLVSVGESELVEHRPVVYQEAGGKRELVAGSYVLRGRNRVGFRLGRYDRSRAVVIDPTLVYSVYLGDGGINSIAVDAAGNAYVTGLAESDFPVTPGAFQTSCALNCLFVAKLNAAGSTLLYSTFLVASNDSEVTGIAIDSAGNAYITGYTNSTTFPVTPSAFQTSLTGYDDAFVTKLNATGSALLYSTFLGGSDDDLSSGIAIDAAGNAYVTGTTISTNFPVTPGAFQTTTSVNGKAFVTKLNAAGSALLYSTYLGGSNGESGRSIALDAARNAYVTGGTQSMDFPVTPGAFQTSSTGSDDAFVTKLNATGSAVLYSTFLGGSAVDAGSGIAIDNAGNAYVTGYTSSKDFPLTPGAFRTTYGGNYDAFVTKLNAAGSALLYSTILGNGGTSTFGIAVDSSSGETYVTGDTYPMSIPVTPGAFQTHCGSLCSFVTKLNASGSALLYSTYLSTSDVAARAIAIDATGNAYVVGQVFDGGLPVTPGAFQASCGGICAFVVKLDTTPGGPVISFVGVSPGPPKKIQLSSQDQQSGLAGVQVLNCTNCTAVTDSFVPGTKDSVITTATKIDQTLGSSVGIEAIDVDGNSTAFDPTDITIQADGRTEVQLVRISGLEHVVVVTNGTPGVRAVVLRVRGRDVPVLSLKDGETRTVDIAKELVAGRNNEMTVLSWGPRGASASVVFTQP